MPRAGERPQAAETRPGRTGARGTRRGSPRSSRPGIHVGRCACPDSRVRGGGYSAPGRRLNRHFGLEAYGFPPSAFEMSAIAFWAFTLFPALSRGGEITAIPNFPGDT